MSTHTTALTVHDELIQGTPGWKAARCGLVTASTIGALITASRPAATTIPCPEEKCGAPAGMPCVNLRTGADITTLHDARKQAAADSPEPDVLTVANNDTALALRATLAAERITSHVEETSMTSDMWRGRELEPLARDAYAEQRGVDVTEVGFMTLDIGGAVIGYSPDDLIGDDGLFENKAPRQKKQILTVLADEIPPEHMPQLQTGLFVSGRDWIDFVQYVGGMPLWIKRAYPDPRWFAAIDAAARDAEKKITTLVDRYTQATHGQPVMDMPLEYGEIR